MNEALLPEIRSIVQARLHRQDTPGAVVALVIDGTLAFLEGIGFADLAQTKPLKHNARFYIYSVTKTIVATAILQLVQVGHLSLDEPVQRYLPDIGFAAPITLRQLLNHSGGVPDYGALPAYHQALRAHPHQAWSREQFLNTALQDGLLFAPGEGWHYSNIGYLLLVMTLEIIHGAPLHDVLAQQVFSPLGLRETKIARSLQDAGKLSPGFTTALSADHALEDMRKRYDPGWVAHGLVISTAEELARLWQTLLGGQLLSPVMLEAMRQPQIVPVVHRFFRQPSYGLGLMLDPQSPYGLVAGHGGGGPGYSTAALAFRDVAGQAVIAVVLANRDAPDLGFEVAFDLVELLAARN